MNFLSLLSHSGAGDVARAACVIPLLKILPLPTTANVMQFSQNDDQSIKQYLHATNRVAAEREKSAI
jgi:hypothetical protein